MTLKGKFAVATLGKDGTALLRIFDTDDQAGHYHGMCRYSDATRILRGRCKTTQTLEKITGEVAHLFDISDKAIRVAFGFEKLT